MPSFLDSIHSYVAPLLILAGLGWSFTGMHHSRSALRLPPGAAAKNLKLMRGFRVAMGARCGNGSGTRGTHHSPIVTIAPTRSAGRLPQLSRTRNSCQMWPESRLRFKQDAMPR